MPRRNTIMSRADLLLDPLNDRQREAVTATDGPVLILAGAGSGKTRTLTHRIAYIIHTKRLPPENLLALTFTNKAAREMRERIRTLVGGRRAPVAGTFHSFCARILRTHGNRVGIPPSFTIYDTDQSRSLMKSVIIDHHLSPKDVIPASVLSGISRWKDELQTPADALAAADGMWEKRVATLWGAYEKRLAEMQATDFDGLLTGAAKLLREHEDIRLLLQEQYPYISVDEYQDTNHAQFMLLRLLAGNTGNICAVGDDAQAIYGWRGARIENIREFPNQFPGCTIITLDQNYRSTKRILSSANCVIAESGDAFEKELWTENDEGSHPSLIRADDEKDEGRRILRVFLRLFENESYSPSDAAILYRTNAQSRALEEACLAHGVPYEIVGGLTFYERREVKDIVAYLAWLQNPKDELAFRRFANVPTRGIGDRTVEALLAKARAHNTHPLDPAAYEQAVTAQRLPSVRELAAVLQQLRESIDTTKPTELLHELLDRLSFRRYLRDESIRTTGTPDQGERRYENVLELATVAERHKTLNGLLEEVALISDAEKTSSRSSKKRERVRMMTIHAAKGLEFPIVAVAGMEEGLLPHLNSQESAAGIEEERRLCYVAMTRARQELLLSYARTRHVYGRTIETSPSRFLAVIPDIRLTESSPEDQAAPHNTGTFMDEPAVHLDNEPVPYKPGDTVHHDMFGTGTVRAISGTNITVAFPAGEKVLDATIAPLQ